jgi:hypothetical protein
LQSLVQMSRVLKRLGRARIVRGGKAIPAEPIGAI